MLSIHSPRFSPSAIPPKPEFFVSNLFDSPVPEGGLRGDDIIWLEMAKISALIPLPPSSLLLQELLQDIFKKNTGVLVEEDTRTTFCLERLSPRNANDHPGEGMIYLPFWRETVFPELLARYENAKNPKLSSKKNHGTGKCLIS